MGFNDFNFAQPLWLYGLFLIPLGWGWYKYWQRSSKANLNGLNKFIDAKLLPHLLIKSSNNYKTINYGWYYMIMSACIIIALANPRWNYEDLDAYQNTASMVILLDLSASMNAVDITPSRIIRARQSIEDLLNLSKGLKIGLVGFAGNPHLISPITDDIATVKTYIPALDTDLTSLQGNSFNKALQLCDELLANEPGEQKSVLIVSDGNFVNVDFSKELSALTSHGVNIHVLGVGTAAGAPYKNNNGSLHKSQGKLIVSKLNSSGLQDIAKQGHGIYTEVLNNDAGVKAILRKAEYKHADDQIVAGKVRQWQDRYYWFIFPAAIILLYLMRQRVLYACMGIVLSSLVYTPDIMALDLSNAFKNSEQLGQQAYVNAEFESAAELFCDAYHKGVALYRAGQYAQAEQQFNNVSRHSIKLDAQYNAGNAQMQQQKWTRAIKSYEAVLKIDPEHFAAKHNLEIAKKMLDQNGDQEEEQQNQDNEQDNKDSAENKNNKQDDQKNQDNEQNNEQDNKDSAENKNNKQDDQKNDNSKNKQLDKQESEQKSQEQQNNQGINKNFDKIDEAQAQQLLDRIDSDIKVFLKNKFYIEDVISAQ